MQKDELQSSRWAIKELRQNATKTKSQHIKEINTLHLRLKEKDEHYNVIIKERDNLKNNKDKLLKELHEVHAKLEQLQNTSSTIFNNNDML